MALTLIGWPENFLIGFDNTIPYAYALRLMPEYWHSILLSCLYTASLMILPHGFSIMAIQCTLFVGAIGYFYIRLDQSPVLGNLKVLKYFPFCLIIFRDAYYVFNNPERAEYNASFLLIFLVTLIFDILDGKCLNEKSDKKSLLGFICFGAFLSVFRSEGIVIALIGTVAYIFVSRKKIKERVLYTALYFVLLVAFMLPGKVGEIKYYGNDYTIINTFPTLQNILNSEEANLSYDGAPEDLEAVEKIVPVNLVAEYGTWSYRRYNYSKGHVDFNQSMADKETSDSFIKAYRRLVINNIPIFLKTQLSMVSSALGSGQELYEEPYCGQHTEIVELGRELWNVGTEDMYEVPLRKMWEHFSVRINIFQAYVIARFGYTDFLTETKIYFGSIIAEIFAGLAIMIVSFIKLLKKKRAFTPLFISSFALNAYIFLLALAIPVEANMYFHAYIYSMFAVIIIFAGVLLSNKDGSKA